MPFDGAFGHEQSLRDRGAGVALGYESEDLELSRGERRVEWTGFGDVPSEFLYLAGAALEVGRSALERFLSEFGLGDVLHDQDDADWLAGRVDDDLAAAAQCADSTVGAQPAVFERE